ncbi:MAG: class I SAM-dependent methyltransferase [Bacteriovoracaceae bacterium]|nr:class I SAM-dependent methyltransferase [Bacteriovoracaceae bacterium]
MITDFAKKYFDLIHGHFSGLNLTAIKDFDLFLEQQVKDSLAPFERFPKANDALLNSSLIIDLGCGGGVPILPLASNYPEKLFLGVDARKKKAAAVSEMATMLSLENVSTLGERMENIYLDRKGVVVLVKAVGKIADVLKYIQSKHKVTVFFYKGSNWENLEFAHSPQINNNWKLEEVFEMKFPNLGNRYLLMYQGSNETDKNKNSVLLSATIDKHFKINSKINKQNKE